MKEYKIEIVGGHILVNDDRGSKVLLDTGSPLSFHDDGVVALGGESFKVQTSLMGISLMGVDSAYVTKNVGTKVDGLVGMDILGKSGFLIDVPSGRIVLGQTTEGWNRINSHSFLGYVFFEMEIRGHKAKIILDTGAPISYVSPSLTEGLDAVDTVEDFNPTVPGGRFTTSIYEFPATFAGQKFEMRAGHLPNIMRAELSLLGVDGVVGMELLKRQPLLIADGGVWV